MRLVFWFTKGRLEQLPAKPNMALSPDVLASMRPVEAGSTMNNVKP